MLGTASKLRSRVVPKQADDCPLESGLATAAPQKRAGCKYWPWLELLKPRPRAFARRTFTIDVRCAHCQGPMKLLALVKDESGITRFLESLGETTEAPAREPARAPRVLEKQSSSKTELTRRPLSVSAKGCLTPEKAVTVLRA